MSDTQRSQATAQWNSAPSPGESSLLWTVWFTYGAFYFCRTNISAAVPGLKASVESGGLGLEATEVGYILGAMKIAYATGQFINGQLSEVIPPRKMLAIGMLGTALLNVLFGFGTAAYFLIFIWACNGYCQSLGWTPCVRIVANWVPVLRRGKALGLIGTGYQAAGVATYVVSGFAAQHFGWRGAFWVPAGIMLVAAIMMLVLLDEKPPNERQIADDPPNPYSEEPARRQPQKTSAWQNFTLTMTNPALWLLGISLGLLNACRYGFVDWGLSHLKEVQETGVAMAAVKYAVLPCGGIAGSYLAGWATDRFFGSRRAPVTCGLLLLLGVLTLTYDVVARTSVPATIGLLLLIGFCVYGPQVLLVGTFPADLARKGTSAAAAGFVNAMGYLGAAGGDFFTGRSLDAYNWNSTIYLWAGWAFGAAIAAGLLWNATAPKDEATKQTTQE